MKRADAGNPSHEAALLCPNYSLVIYGRGLALALTGKLQHGVTTLVSESPVWRVAVSGQSAGASVLQQGFPLTRNCT